MSEIKLKLSICISCGLPASGKTTYWRKFVEFSESNRSEAAALVIEYDKVVPQTWLELAEDVESGPREINVSWKAFRHQVLLVVQSLILSVQLYGENGFAQLSQPDGVNADIWKNILPHLASLDSKWQGCHELFIIIDDNMYFRSMRYEYFKLARKCCIGFCQVHFQCSAAEALKRNAKRMQEHQVPDVVISKMAEKLEPPNKENYAWEKFSLTIESTRSSSNHDHSILQLLVSSLSNPVQAQTYPSGEEVIKSRIQGSASLLHQADLILRKCVSAWMEKSTKSSSKRDLKCKAKDALKTKDMILARLKVDPLSFGVSDEWAIDFSSFDPASDFYKFISEAFFYRMHHLPT